MSLLSSIIIFPTWENMPKSPSRFLRLHQRWRRLWKRWSSSNPHITAIKTCQKIVESMGISDIIWIHVILKKSTKIHVNMFFHNPWRIPGKIASKHPPIYRTWSQFVGFASIRPSALGHLWEDNPSKIEEKTRKKQHEQKPEKTFYIRFMMIHDSDSMFLTSREEEYGRPWGSWGRMA